MSRRLTVDEYFRYPETLRPNELVFGLVREPPAPRYGHQSIVTRVTVMLDLHVRARGLGTVCVSPVDVVLDYKDALVVQPDVLFVSAERLDIICDRVWGPPDLVVEVLSRRTARRDRGEKLHWYRRYGVRECWLLDQTSHRVEVVGFPAHGRNGRHAYRGAEVVRSSVLPDFSIPAREFFE